MFQTVLFYLFAAILIFSALRVITEKNPVHAVLFLVLCFFNSAVLWLLIEAEFLAIVLILVYVGAVMVLFLFVVMMLNVYTAASREGYAKYLPLAMIIVAIIVIELILVLAGADFGANVLTALPAAETGNATLLGQLMYSAYLYPFELAAAILLVAMVAAITLTHRRRADSKHQDPAQQIQREAVGRVTMHDIRADDFLRQAAEQSETAPNDTVGDVS